METILYTSSPLCLATNPYSLGILTEWKHEIVILAEGVFKLSLLARDIN